MSSDYRYRHGEPMGPTKAFVLIRDAFADAAITMHPEGIAYAMGYAEFILEQHKAYTKKRQEDDLQDAARAFRKYEPTSDREEWAHGLAWTFCEMVFDKAQPWCSADGVQGAAAGVVGHAAYRPSIASVDMHEAREAACQAAAVRAAAEVARTPDPRTEVQYANDLQAADAGAYEEKLRELIRVVRCMPDATSARPTRAVLEKTAELIQTLERWGLIATVSPA